MTYIEAALLGLLQGLTEFIPISSSGHLVIAQHVFGNGSDHIFLEVINVGTFAALLAYFRKRIIEIIRDILVNKKLVLARNILITSIPAGILGFMLSDFIANNYFFGSVVVVVVTLLAVGILMVILESLPKASAIQDGSKLSKARALWVGFAQAIALIPGVSRSGATIIAGRFAGLKPAQAAEYSFLASLPIMAGVALKTVIFDTSYISENLSILIVGNIFAFASGLLAVGFLMKYLANHSLAIFGWYRIVLAVLLIGAIVLL